jgi:Pectate lyase superfamily protein
MKGLNLIIIFLISSAAFGQTTNSNFANLNNIRFANAFPGSDECARIRAAIADLPATGGTVDARGIQGAQTCTTAFWGGITKNVVVWLDSQITEDVNDTIPANITVIMTPQASIAAGTSHTLTNYANLKRSGSPFPYNVKDYGAAGNDLTDDTTAIQNTVNALLPCAQAGTTWAHCGTVLLPPGKYKTTTPITVSSPFVYLRGDSTGAVTVDAHITEGCAIEWTANPYNAGQPDTNAGGVFNLTIDGRHASAGTCGLETYDINGFKSRGLSIANFTGSGSSGWWDNTIKHWNERFDISMELANNTADWFLQNSHTSRGGNTFGYGIFNLTLNCGAGQTCIKSKGISPKHRVQLDLSQFQILANMSGSATCADLSNYSNFSTYGMFHCEETSGSGQTGVTVDSTSSVQILGGYSSPGPDSGHISYLSLSGTGLGSNAATVEGYDNLHGLWLKVQGQSGFVNVAPPATMRNAIQVVLPSESGTLLLRGRDGVSSGTVMLSAGSGLHTFSTPYSTAPVCVASDQTAARAVQVTTTTTAVTFAGSGRDEISWVCTPAAN